MVTLGNQEEELIDQLVSCLAIAIDTVDDVGPNDFNETKTQKFIYFAVDEFQFPLTYSWYLAGSLVESRTVTATALESPEGLEGPSSPSIETDEADDLDKHSDVAGTFQDDESPLRSLDTESVIDKEFAVESAHDAHLADEEFEVSDAKEQLQNVHESLSDDVRNQINSRVSLPIETDVEPADIVELYRDKLDEYPLHPTDRFLQQFYKYHAPEQFRSLYVSCLHLRSAIRAFVRDIEAGTRGERMQDNLDDHEKQIGKFVSEVHFELYGSGILEETAEYVVRGTDIIEDTVLKLKSMDISELTEDQLELIAGLQDFYFGTVWKFPALRVSIETATGPSQEEIREARTEQLEEYEQYYTDQLKSLTDELAAAGLQPSVADYPPLEQTEFNEALVSLHQEYTMDITDQT